MKTLDRPTVVSLEIARGCAASTGVGRGRARFAHNMAEAVQVGRDEVLICRSLDARWVPLLAPPAAVVGELGGALSTGATALRERGVPAVMGVGNLLGRLEAGDPLEVDGGEGLVRSLTADR